MRVWAIPGVFDDYGLGPEFARAQSTLIESVRRYDHATNVGILRALVEVGRERPPPAVLAALARGCLLAGFARGDLPEDIEAEPGSAPELEPVLTGQAAALEEATEHRAKVHALGNARILAAAARV